MIIRILTIVILIVIIISSLDTFFGSNNDLNVPFSSGPTGLPNKEAPSYPPPNSN